MHIVVSNTPKVNNEVAQRDGTVRQQMERSAHHHLSPSDRRLVRSLISLGRELRGAGRPRTAYDVGVKIITKCYRNDIGCFTEAMDSFRAALGF